MSLITIFMYKNIKKISSSKFNIADNQVITVSKVVNN